MSLRTMTGPREWTYTIEPSGRRWLVYLTSGILRYGPNKWGWYRWTLEGAIQKGQREAAKKNAEEAEREANLAAAERFMRAQAEVQMAVRHKSILDPTRYDQIADFPAIQTGKTASQVIAEMAKPIQTEPEPSPYDLDEYLRRQE